MASPHAAGVAALAVGAHGAAEGRSGFGLARTRCSGCWSVRPPTTPARQPRLQTYTNEGRDASYNALCVGSADRNGFYGEGIVNAFGAVR